VESWAEVVALQASEVKSQRAMPLRLCRCAIERTFFAMHPGLDPQWSLKGATVPESEPDTPKDGALPPQGGGPAALKINSINP
jgi:hypothetical protein